MEELGWRYTGSQSAKVQSRFDQPECGSGMGQFGTYRCSSQRRLIPCELSAPLLIDSRLFAGVDAALSEVRQQCPPHPVSWLSTGLASWVSIMATTCSGRP